jgi:hypothetical protein
VGPAIAATITFGRAALISSVDDQMRPLIGINHIYDHADAFQCLAQLGSYMQDGSFPASHYSVPFHHLTDPQVEPLGISLNPQDMFGVGGMG